MPIFNLICSTCQKRRRVVRSQGWRAAAANESCVDPRCPGILERDSGASMPTTLVKETIDNGVMVKSLERLAEAERLHKDRVEIEDALAKGKDTGMKIR